MPTLKLKNKNAIDAVTQLVFLLERCKEYNWAEHFYPILDALKELDYDRAIELYRQIPMPNMGGLLDLYLCDSNGHTIRDLHKDNKLLIEIRGAVSVSLGNLEIYLKNETDRPLVHIPNCT